MAQTLRRPCFHWVSTVYSLIRDPVCHMVWPKKKKRLFPQGNQKAEAYIDVQKILKKESKENA